MNIKGVIVKVTKWEFDLLAFTFRTQAVVFFGSKPIAETNSVGIFFAEEKKELVDSVIALAKFARGMGLNEGVGFPVLYKRKTGELFNQGEFSYRDEVDLDSPMLDGVAIERNQP